MDRRKRHLPRIGPTRPERRKTPFDRRRHRGLFRILFIPLDRFFERNQRVVLT
jgi:hypothetical protein